MQETTYQPIPVTASSAETWAQRVAEAIEKQQSLLCVGLDLERCAYEAFAIFKVDAVTAIPAPGRQALAPLFSRPGKGCFMVTRLSNPGAGELQDLETAGGEPLYATIARRLGEEWNE